MSECEHVFKHDPDYGESCIYCFLTRAEYTVELKARIAELETALTLAYEELTGKWHIDWEGTLKIIRDALPKGAK